MPNIQTIIAMAEAIEAEDIRDVEAHNAEYANAPQDLAEQQMLERWKETKLGEELWRDAVFSPENKPGMDCSLNWHRALSELDVPIVHFHPEKPVPKDLLDALEGKKLEKITTVFWRGEDWVVVSLVSREGTPYIGEDVRWDQAVFLSLARASEIEF